MRSYRGRRPASYYEVAQVCLNGYIITTRYNMWPQRRKNFCPTCGAKTITQCPNCGESVQGEYIVPGTIGGSSDPPAYCHSCGQVFPWTSMRLEAARQLTLEKEELDDEKEVLADSLSDLMTDTPKTTVAAQRWKKALEKLSEHSASALKQIIVEIASETAKKLLFP